MPYRIGIEYAAISRKMYSYNESNLGGQEGVINHGRQRRFITNLCCLSHGHSLSLHPPPPSLQECQAKEVGETEKDRESRGRTGTVAIKAQILSTLVTSSWPPSSKSASRFVAQLCILLDYIYNVETNILVMQWKKARPSRVSIRPTTTA